MKLRILFLLVLSVGLVGCHMPRTTPLPSVNVHGGRGVLSASFYGASWDTGSADGDLAGGQLQYLYGFNDRRGIAFSLSAATAEEDDDEFANEESFDEWEFVTSYVWELRASERIDENGEFRRTGPGLAMSLGGGVGHSNWELEEDEDDDELTDTSRGFVTGQFGMQAEIPMGQIFAFEPYYRLSLFTDSLFWQQTVGGNLLFDLDLSDNDLPERLSLGFWVSDTEALEAEWGFSLGVRIPFQ